ncbi:ATP-binding protein [Cytophagales bacterium LB-30]|uniref:histidine kinase n=1 Tax=Shiella aurantiaca TaxID=3058365 RepID=A0ABT8F7I2_9BACT|nr:ATP-binding protein [Shiella aurantiaca]MDN4166397.1 ATP-binding protein [Shiella aurantiaca]
MKNGALHWLLILALSFAPFVSKATDPDSLIVHNFGTSNFKTTAITYLIAEDSSGVLYFANESGLLVFNGSEWNLFTTDGFKAVYSLYIDEQAGRIYSGGMDEFGYFSRDKKGSFVYTSLRERLPADKKIRECWQILKRGNEIIFNSYTNLVVYEDDSVRTIEEKDIWLLPYKDKIYAGVYDKGLGILEKDSIRLMNTKFKWRNDTAYEILENEKGEPVLYTGESGAYSFDEETFETKPLSTPASKHTDKYTFYDATPWRDSLYFYTSYRAGSFIISKKGDLLDSVTQKQDNIPTNYLNNCFTDRRQNIWIASNYGLVYLRWPYHDEILPTKANVHIGKIDIGDSTVFTSAAQLNLSNNDLNKSISFHYATPGYLLEELQYSYYLEGFDQNWSSWRSDIKKEYTNLSGGEYTFRVKARLLNGKEIGSDEIRVSIPTPWYKASWFYAVSVLAISGLVFGLIRFNTKRLKARNRRLESIINQRTIELLEQKEQLADANKELRIINHELDNFVYRSSHDLVAPLKSLKGLIQVAQMESKEEQLNTYLNMMNRSVAKLEDFIKSIMDYSINSKRPLEQLPIDMDAMIDEIMEDIKYYNRVERVKIIREYDADFSFISDPKRLKIVFSNLITNSVKYHNYKESNSPYIKIKASRSDDNKVLLVVQDNGLGIDKMHQGRIFDMFFRATDTSEGSGLGLYIVKDTIDMLKGSIALESHPNVGTTFTITLP